MNSNNLVLNRLFTQYVFHDLVRKKDNPIYKSVIKRYINDAESKDNGILISEIYTYMSKEYRNEYFYQNTLLNKLLLGKHSVNTTTALTQIPIGKSKADFILINGKAVVYEIKTELDTFERLETQLTDYYKAFNHVCIVTCERNYDRLCSILSDNSAGIYVLTSKNTLSLKKEPKEENRYLDYLAIFKVLHKKEYENILLKYYKRLPKVAQVFYYDECFSLFKKIPLLDAYNMALKELKKRNKIIVEEFMNVPYELKYLAYFTNPSKKDYIGLNQFLNRKFGR
ncbi:MAG: sce7726 family protein [Bacillota bacterium]